MDRDDFLYWWPVAARVLGVIGAFAQAGYAVATKQNADTSFLAFCGALIVAPNIFPADRPSRRREKAEEDEEPDA